MLTTGFEPRSSGIRSNHSSNHPMQKRQLLAVCFSSIVEQVDHRDKKANSISDSLGKNIRNTRLLGQPNLVKLVSKNTYLVAQMFEGSLLDQTVDAKMDL